MTANVDSAPITCTEDVARLLQPVVVGGDILAYSYVRELHRAFGIERTIVLATQNIKMLSESRFTDYRLEPHIHEQEGLYNALERIAREVHGAHPEKTLLILGCDDCHAVCPWNKFARRSTLPDFDVRHGLDHARLLELWQWDEATFLQRTEGSPIRRIGHVRWLRNLAVALGNALRQADGVQSQIIRQALQCQRLHPEALVREHVAWALEQGAAG